MSKDLAPTVARRPFASVKLGLRTCLLSTAGFFIIQLAWILALPAFSGTDEFDHAYRAAAVAHGQWVAPRSEATRGTGAWVEAPTSMVRAAHAECATLGYTSDADCVGKQHGAYSKVASGAGRYNPIYYFVIGLPSLVLSGAHALYAMRLMTALTCAIMFYVGLRCLGQWTNSPMAYAAATLSATPVALYSTTVVSPNGFEMFVAFAFWCGIIGLLRNPVLHPPWVMVATTAAASALVTVRSLGPLWCFLIAAVAILAVPGGFRSAIVLGRSRAGRTAAAIVLSATVLSLVWIKIMGSLVIAVAVPPPTSFLDKVEKILPQFVLWPLQAIAAFPYRNDQAPAMVYAIFLILGVGAAVWSWRRGHPRIRAALVVLVILSMLVPGAITWVTFDQFALSWQGRYTLPFSLGFFVLCALALRGQSRMGGPALGLTVLLYGVATITSIVNVRAIELAGSPSVSNDSWTAPPTLLLILLASLGTCLLFAPAISRERPTQ